MRQERLIVSGGDTFSTERHLADRALALVAILAQGVRAWLPIIIFVVAYAVLVSTLLPVQGENAFGADGIIQLLATLAAGAIPMFVIFRLAVYARQGFPASPIRRLWQEARVIIFNPARLLSLVIVFPLLSIFLQAFAVAKGNIPFVNPFAWDETFMRLDRALHGGVDPWRWLEPFLHSVPATFMINFLYNFWFFLSVGSLLWVALQRRPGEDSIRFLVAFLMSWVIGGNILATIFSSAGPAYYARLALSPDPYAPLMAHLHAVAQIVPVWALETQEMLWKGYQAQDVTLGGISAFPSMHNAQATLMALLAWRHGRLAGWLMTIYAFMIAIGSVWLGWHYAVDAYAGIAIALACWWLAGPLARWIMGREAMRRLVVVQERLDATGQK